MKDFFLSPWSEAPSGQGLHDHISARHTTLGRTYLDKWPTRRRDLTKRNSHNRETSISPAGFEPPFAAGEQAETHSLDRVATGVGDRDL
jgi:hypothetical protein